MPSFAVPGIGELKISRGWRLVAAAAVFAILAVGLVVTTVSSASAGGGSMREPATGRITQKINWWCEPWTSSAHPGIDIQNNNGGPILAAYPGFVVFGNDGAGGYGIKATITNNNGWSTVYGHMSSVIGGNRHVVRGEQIGWMGTTGLSTGVHLHFEVRQPGGAVWGSLNDHYNPLCTPGGNTWTTAGNWIWAPFPMASPDSPAVYRINSHWFYARWDWTGGPADYDAGYGVNGDLGLMCDWNGNGTKTFGVFRSDTFYLTNSEVPGTGGVWNFGFGQNGDVPLCGDWDGDGDDEVLVYRPFNRTFYFRANTNTGFQWASNQFDFGAQNAEPFVADWDGNGIDTIGVGQSGAIPNALYWEIRQTNSPGWPDLEFTFGQVGDRPVPGDFDGDGFDSQGLARSNGAPLTWYITHSVFDAFPTWSVNFGAGAGDRAFVW